MVTLAPAVVCTGITKSFVASDSVVHALRGVDLTVAAGELFMLVGPSGCGKTTLISIIAGIMNQSAGRCSVFGTELRDLSERDRSRFRGEKIGFVFQAYNLIPTLTAAENVAVPLIINGTPFPEAVRKAKETLGLVGLADKVSHVPSQFSGGQQQRVAIARALVHSPRLIVCDEPTSALDLENGLRIMDLFRQVVVTPDRALIVVTHDSRIFKYADRIGEMDDGMLTSIHRPDSLPAHL